MAPTPRSGACRLRHRGGSRCTQCCGLVMTCRDRKSTVRGYRRYEQTLDLRVHRLLRVWQFLYSRFIIYLLSFYLTRLLDFPLCLLHGPKTFFYVCTSYHACTTSFQYTQPYLSNFMVMVFFPIFMETRPSLEVRDLRLERQSVPVPDALHGVA